MQYEIDLNRLIKYILLLALEKKISYLPKREFPLLRICVIGESVLDLS